MMNFFTKLLTPVFIALGMVNPTPVVETPTPDIQVQQELIELRQKVQELENEKSGEETEIEIITEVIAIEVKKDVVEKKQNPVINPVNIETVVKISTVGEPIDDSIYMEKLERFNSRVKNLLEEKNRKNKNLLLSKTARELNEAIDAYVFIGIVNKGVCTRYILDTNVEERYEKLMDGSCLQYVDISFETIVNLELAAGNYLEKSDRELRYHTSEIKELQEDWNIKTEDRIY